MNKIIVFFVMVLLGFLVFSWFNRSYVPPADKDGGVTLTIVNTEGYRGSHQNLIDVSLDNPDQGIRGIQLEICDEDNFLSCNGCAVADRIAGFTCASNENKEGCYELLLFSFSEIIEPGTGHIFSFTCDVAEDAPGKQCRKLTPEKIEVADENKQSLAVSVNSGGFCFDDCGAAEDCDAGLWCYGDKECKDGACHSVPMCPDDGLFCNGVEYCDESRNTCNATPEPCAYCYQHGCTCDEEKDACVGYGPGQGPESI
jgi:hypothetical protein